MKKKRSGGRKVAGRAVRRNRGGSEERILDAAERAIARKGYSGATIENFAREAGYSKGGLMHHYHSKREIISGMVDRLEHRFATARKKAVADTPPSPASKSRASLLSLLNLVRFESDTLKSMIGILGESEVKTRMSAARRRLFLDISAGSRKPERIAAAMLVMEGLCLDSFMEYSAFQEQTMTRIVADLVSSFDSLESDFTIDHA